MTEEEWLQSKDVSVLVEYLNNNRWSRKYRLFNCACCHHLRSWFTDDQLGKCLEWAESFADGKLSEHSFAKWQARAVAALRETFSQPQVYQRACYAVIACCSSRKTSLHSQWDAWRSLLDISTEFGDRLGADTAELPLGYFRDVFGNPFRPVAFAPAWRTSDAVGLAQSMYESRDFSPMPILADALDEAGCDNVDILAHCRAENAVHVRGCWVVDLVLGKV